MVCLRVPRLGERHCPHCRGRVRHDSQYRHALGETRYELVAGTCEEGDTAEQSARRELLEETGYAGGVWRRYMVTSPNPTNHTNRVYTFLAESVERVAEQHTEAGEDIKVH